MSRWNIDPKSIDELAAEKRDSASEQSVMPSEIIVKSLVELTVDSWRFAKTFARLVSKLDPAEGARYENQYRYYVKRIKESLEHAGMKLVNVEGHPWDAGLAVTAINLADFEIDDILVIDQMIEPIIMGSDALVRTGTVMLKKVSQ